MHRTRNKSMALFAALVTALVLSGPAKAQTYSVLYNFTGGTDGGAPYAGVIQDAQGNLYGTTGVGGLQSSNWLNGAGVVFKVDPSGNETVLYPFTGGTDGGYPSGCSLVMDKQGNLYGTTQEGGDLSYTVNGKPGVGVVFKLSPPSNGGQTWTETVLYPFTGGVDGYNPNGVIMDAQGNLYGTTYYGGTSGVGVVFKLSPPSNGGQTWTETVLHSFTGGTDGGYPSAPPVLDAQGNLYVTTYGGGAYGYGVVFKLSPPYGLGNDTVLYSFTGGADGSVPTDGVIVDSHGNVYGTTYEGGSGYGVVYELSPPYGQTNEHVLYTFSGGTDGAYPLSGLIMDNQDNLYGTTYKGGSGYGVVYELSPPYGQGNEKVLYTFNSTDGANPIGNQFADAQGNLYGTTYGGGTYGAGVVYKLASAGLSGLSISPSTITGGNTATGTVTLNVSAPPGGAMVSLSSSNTAVVQVPANVTIAQGQTSATFPVTTSTVNSDTDISVTITASYNGSSQMTTLTVTKRTLKSIKVKPKTVKGGNLAIGTVTLSTAAPTGGSVVSLSSSDPTVTVPASVTVPAGQMTTQFVVMTSTVSMTKVTISAMYGGTTKSAKLKVKT